MRVLAPIVAVVLGFGLSVASDNGPEAKRIYPAETIDDAPPTGPLPLDDETARSPGLRILNGSYTSVQVNVDNLGMNIVGDAANEPSIAVNPLNSNNMVIGWRQFDTIANNFRQAGVAHTMDGGTTWIYPGPLTPGIFRSDPVLDTDQNGVFYYQSLRQDFSMQVFRSVDGGVTWLTPIFSWGGDKNWMVVDKSGSIGDGHIYGMWREPFGCCGPSVFTRSIDAGASYQTPVPAQRSPGLGTMAVGPDGEVYLTGIDELGTGEYVSVRSVTARDENLSPTFAATSVPMGGTLIFGGTPNPGGLVGQANIAVDHSLETTRGNVYLLSTVDPFASFSLQPAAVHISRSEDGGATWSPPVPVNDDPTTNGAWHWMAAHAVAPNGRIDVIWNDTRDSGNALLSRLYYSYSYDAGQTWADNVAVSPEFNSTVGWPQQSKIGDYYTIISDVDGGHVAYSATFNGEQDVYYVNVFPDCNTNGIPDPQETPDCNGNYIPDSCEESTGCGAAGVIPSGLEAEGLPLLIGKADGDDLSLLWGASCKLADFEFGIYEGEMLPGGDFTSHTIHQCGTGGNTTAEITPEAGSRYFLVVPLNADHEGSYGKNSAGVQRVPGVAQCEPQLVGSCLGVGGN